MIGWSQAGQGGHFGAEYGPTASFRPTPGRKAELVVAPSATPSRPGTSSIDRRRGLSRGHALHPRHPRPVRCGLAGAMGGSAATNIVEAKLFTMATAWRRHVLMDHKTSEGQHVRRPAALARLAAPCRTFV